MIITTVPWRRGTRYNILWGRRTLATSVEGSKITPDKANEICALLEALPSPGDTPYSQNITYSCSRRDSWERCENIHVSRFLRVRRISHQRSHETCLEHSYIFFWEHSHHVVWWNILLTLRKLDTFIFFAKSNETCLENLYWIFWVYSNYVLGN